MDARTATRLLERLLEQQICIFCDNWGYSLAFTLASGWFWLSNHQLRIECQPAKGDKSQLINSNVFTGSCKRAIWWPFVNAIHRLDGQPVDWREPLEMQISKLSAFCSEHFSGQPGLCWVRVKSTLWIVVSARQSRRSFSSRENCLQLNILMFSRSSLVGSSGSSSGRSSS